VSAVFRFRFCDTVRKRTCSTDDTAELSIDSRPEVTQCLSLFNYDRAEPKVIPIAFDEVSIASGQERHNLVGVGAARLQFNHRLGGLIDHGRLRSVCKISTSQTCSEIESYRVRLEAGAQLRVVRAESTVETVIYDPAARSEIGSRPILSEAICRGVDSS
jgi:hypothetical protein